MPLMEHQVEGIEFLLSRKSGLIAFEQGLGKTLVAIEAFTRLRASEAVDALLVVCPNSLKRNWEAEIARFAPELSVCVIERGAAARRRQMADSVAAVVVVNYETARAEVSSLRALLRRRRCALVFDECHAVKNRHSLTSIAAGHFAELSEYRWLLSGTPAPNSPADIYAQVHLVAGRRVLGSFEMFDLEYGQAGHDSATQLRLSEAIAPFVLRRTKEQCLDLPEKSFVDLLVELPPWQRRLYDDMRDSAVREVRGMSRDAFAAFAPSALTRLLRLSQLASNPSLVAPDEARIPAKLDELDRLVHELVAQNGKKVIIWSYYVRTIETMLSRYRPLGAVALYGGVPADQRQQIATRFQSDPAVRVLIANPAVAGTGFTLTAASYTIYETVNWRYDLYAQSQDRNHRIGQQVPVTYVRLVASDTIDQVIVEALTRKDRMARSIVGDDVGTIDVAGMSPDEFCAMLVENRLPQEGPQSGGSPN